MNRQPLYNTGILILAVGIFLLHPVLLFADQSEIIAITVKLNRSPEIVTIQPPDESRGYTPGQIRLTVDAQDEDGDNLLYQFSCDGEIIRPWQSSNEFTWSTAGLSLGIHTIRIEVKDTNGGADMQEIELCLFIKPPDLPSL